MDKSNNLSTQPYKGTQDFFPEEMQVRRYIYDVWRDVCESFGYAEYQTPLLEAAEIYRAKSGDEVGGKELFTLRDLSDRELAIRPEMTPSVTRMVARKYPQLPKPIRLYSIANFARNERPQRGRNREFVQLNVDIFGEDSLSADIEILTLAIEVMESFGAPEGSFILKLNNRKLLDAFLNEISKGAHEMIVELTRILDKYEKLTTVTFEEALAELSLDSESTALVHSWMQSSSLEELQKAFPDLVDSEGFADLEVLLATMRDLGYEDRVVFSPGLVRGFDYYDGMVFEVFDTHPENNRSLFGGGRYNGLAHLFGAENFPAVGCAPGDETLALFLTSWNLVPDFSVSATVYIPLLQKDATKMYQMAHELRYEGLVVITGTKETTVIQALREANQREYAWIILLGEEESANGKYTLKNMRSGEQKEVTSIEELLQMIQSENL